MQVIDISQPLRRGMVVWPGDQPFEARWSGRIAEGSSVNVGAMTLSLHTGTHADAPLHVADEGAPINSLPLSAYLGPVAVVEAIRTDAIPADALAGVDLRQTPRVLFKTRREGPPEAWTDEFAHLSAALAQRLAIGGAVLVGLDTPSVDHATSRTLDAHHALFGGKVAVLENLRLDRVAPGRYFLCALPLKIEGMDGSPVRAALLTGLL